MTTPPPANPAPEYGADRIYELRQMPISCCPKGAPVLVAGGIAMLKTGGTWVSGMSEPPFTRELDWTPEWWANIPQGNEPLTPPRHREG